MKKYKIVWEHKRCPILSQNFMGSNEIHVEAMNKREAITLAKRIYLEIKKGPRNVPDIKEVRFT